MRVRKKSKTRIFINSSPYKLVEDLNSFMSEDKIDILDIQYSTSCVDNASGSCAVVMHSALVVYMEYEDITSVGMDPETVEKWYVVCTNQYLYLKGDENGYRIENRGVLS